MSGALRNLAIDARNKDLLGEGDEGRLGEEGEEEEEDAGLNRCFHR